MKPLDIIVILMTATISIIVLLSVTSSLWFSHKMSEEGLSILSEAVAGMLSIIAVYVGTKLTN